jgi:hypothetical protein
VILFSENTFPLTVPGLAVNFEAHFLRDRLMAGHLVLAQVVGVRVLLPQLKYDKRFLLAEASAQARKMKGRMVFHTCLFLFLYVKSCGGSLPDCVSRQGVLLPQLKQD